MSTWFGFAISCLALMVSGITAWLTFFRKGKLLMTQPTTVFFGGRTGRSLKGTKARFTNKKGTDLFSEPRCETWLGRPNTT
jgi:hypothetical protein